MLFACANVYSSMNEPGATAFSFSPALNSNSFSAYQTLGIRPHGFAHGAFLNSSPNQSTQNTAITTTNYIHTGSNKSLLKLQPSTGGGGFSGIYYFMYKTH